MDENIQTIKIDEDGKYIIIVEGIGDMEFIQKVRNLIQDWWESDDKFLIFASHSGAKVRLEKVEKDG